MAMPTFILPIVSLKSASKDADLELGEPFKEHGCVVVSDHGLRPEMLIAPETARTRMLDISRVLLERISRYLGEPPSTMADAVARGPSELVIPGVMEPEKSSLYACCPLLTLFYAVRPTRFVINRERTRKDGGVPAESLIATVGEVLAEWTARSQKKMRAARLEDLKDDRYCARFYAHPHPETPLQLMPRRTVQQFREECLGLHVIP